MTVSIVLPTYNRAPWLPGAIGSVLAQTWQDWELVVVDDGSTDETSKVLAEYADQRIRVLRQSNVGQTWATRRGVEATSRPYIALLSSDDELTPNALDDQIPLLDCIADVTYGNFLVEWIDTIFDGSAGERKVRKVDPPDVLPTRNVIAGSMFTRAMYNAIGGWSAHWILGNDWAFYLTAYASGYKFARLSSVTYVYRYHKSGQTFQRRQLQLDECDDIAAKYKAGLLDVRTLEGHEFLTQDAPRSPRMG